jgi:hypothetical protein
MNKTDNNFTITLFPKTEFIYNDLYDFSEIGGGYRKTVINVVPDDKAQLYISGNLQIQPNDLVKLVFDSIHIKPFNEDKIEMKFSPDTVIGYSENLYDDNSVWIYEQRNYSEKTNFSIHPIESYDYSFVISPDKYF